MPWKRASEPKDDIMPDLDPQKLDAVMEGLITQAGVDYEWVLSIILIHIVS